MGWGIGDAAHHESSVMKKIWLPGAYTVFVVFYLRVGGTV